MHRVSKITLADMIWEQLHFHVMDPFKKSDC